MNEPQPGVMPLLEMFNRHKDLYCGATPLARIAVWRNQRSLAWISFDTQIAAMVVEHVLFKRRIPFSIVQDEFITPDALRDFDLVILPDVEFLNDEHLQTLCDFTERGGALLITERSGTYNSRGRRRAAPAFGPMFASALDASARGREEAISFDPARQFASKDHNGAPATVCFGKGRAAYLPALQYRYPPRTFKSRQNVHYDAIDSRYWKDPWNVDELLGLIEWLTPDFAPVRIYGHPEVRFDWLRFRDGEEGVALVRTGKLDVPADLRFALRASTPPCEARLFRPGTDKSAPLRWTQRGEYVETLLPGVLRHAVLKYPPPQRTLDMP